MKKEKTKEQKQAEAFENWMRNRIKNIHYANHEKMSLAFEKFYK